MTFVMVRGIGTEHSLNGTSTSDNVVLQLYPEGQQRAAVTPFLGCLGAPQAMAHPLGHIPGEKVAVGL
jgi:hypothetical protein